MIEPSAKFRVGDVAVWALDGVFFFAAGMAIDADGAPDAYHPPTPERPQSGRPPGLDDLRNAGKPGQWYGIVTDGDGEPVVQGANDPCPGFYVSQTALEDLTAPRRSPRRYVDSSAVPYFSLPARAFHGVAELGDLGMVVRDGLSCAAIYADIGPSTRIGEGSIALAKALGLFHSVSVGHDLRDVVYVVFPGTRASPHWPRARENIEAAAAARFAAWGGMERLRGLYPYMVRSRTGAAPPPPKERT